MSSSRLQFGLHGCPDAAATRAAEKTAKCIENTTIIAGAAVGQAPLQPLWRILPSLRRQRDLKR
jgi:hypothetical protein